MSEEFIQKSRLVPSRCGEHVLNIHLRQSRIIVPAGRLMKESESSKHKITHVSMQKKGEKATSSMAPAFATMNIGLIDLPFDYERRNKGGWLSAERTVTNPNPNR